MRRTLYRWLALAALALPAACGGASQSSRNSANAVTITVVGSTALLPLVKEAAVEYQAAHSNVKISVSGGGSITGITQVAQKAADIGDSDVPAPGQPALVDHKVAVMPFTIATNPQAGVKNLTSAQIRDVFTGKVKNWRRVGGADLPITIVNRPRSSGTRAAFVDKVMHGMQPTDTGLTQDSSGTVAAMVSQTAGAASYMAMSYLRPGVQAAVSIDGVAPTDANVQSGRYPFWEYEHMFTNGQPSAQVADFIAFVKSNETLLRKLRLIPVHAMKTR